jgi:hypothetical protein
VDGGTNGWRRGSSFASPGTAEPSTDPAVIEAVKLKDTANSLLKSSDFTAAVKSYTDAIAALDDATDSAGKQPVWTACQLNLAHTYLQSENWAAAAAACDRVCDSRSAMESSAARLKAHYRRGWARKELGQLADVPRVLGTHCYSRKPFTNSLVFKKGQARIGTNPAPPLRIATFWALPTKFGTTFLK